MYVAGSIEADDFVIFDNGLILIDENLHPLEVDRHGSSGDLISFENDGQIIGDISFSGTTVSYNAFTGSHYTWTDQEIQRGMLVSMIGDNKHFHDDPELEILYGIKITLIKNDPAILGTYLGIKEQTLQANTANPHLVMSEGNGEVWIADTGEDINPGDYLISSLVPGHAMKDDRSEEISHIVGRAAEPIVWDEVNETINGIKHKKISILFNFVPLNNQILD